MSGVRYHLTIDGKPGRLVQQRTPTGLPRCLNCQQAVPARFGRRHRQGRFCTDQCAIRWALHVVKLFEPAELWRP